MRELVRGPPELTHKEKHDHVESFEPKTEKRGQISIFQVSTDTNGLVSQLVTLLSSPCGKPGFESRRERLEFKTMNTHTL